MPTSETFKLRQSVSYPEPIVTNSSRSARSKGRFTRIVPRPRHSPMLIHTYHAVPMPQPCHGLERSLSEQHICGVAGERHGVCVNQTRPRCVNQMGTTHSKPLAELHVRGTAWERHGMCESTLAVARQAAYALKCKLLKRRDIIIIIIFVLHNSSYALLWLFCVMFQQRFIRYT
jgi:hypothetical protein